MPTGQFECDSQLKRIREEHIMKSISKGFLGSAAALVLSASPALANAPGGGYEGITAMYVGFIAVILGYGVYDIFFKSE